MNNEKRNTHRQQYSWKKETRFRKRDVRGWKIRSINFKHPCRWNQPSGWRTLRINWWDTGSLVIRWLRYNDRALGVLLIDTSRKNSYLRYIPNYQAVSTSVRYFNFAPNVLDSIQKKKFLSLTQLWHVCLISDDTFKAFDLFFLYFSWQRKPPRARNEWSFSSLLPGKKILPGNKYKLSDYRDFSRWYGTPCSSRDNVLHFPNTPHNLRHATSWNPNVLWYAPLYNDNKKEIRSKLRLMVRDV